MGTLWYLLRRLATGIPLILGVTFISFLLMIYFGPDLTFELVGKNPTPEQIAAARAQLGYDQPLMLRYLDYLREMVTFDFGRSISTCLLYTSPSPRDRTRSRMPSSA